MNSSPNNQHLNREQKEKNVQNFRTFTIALNKRYMYVDCFLITKKTYVPVHEKMNCVSRKDSDQYGHACIFLPFRE